MTPGVWLSFLVAVAPVGADGGVEPGLSLSDLAPYRAALEAPKERHGAAVPVTFHDLWGQPERYEGRRVRVEGRVVRRFRQGKFGTFPPLAEVWAVTPSGDPFCLVYPASGADSAPGAWVRFEGTFLRRLRYQGGDAARLAPLIVGDRPPSVTSPAPLKADPGLKGSVGSGRFDWVFGLAAVSLVALLVARRHLTGTARLVRRPEGDKRAPEFIEPA